MAEAIALFILTPIVGVLLQRGSHHCLDLLLEKEFLTPRVRDRLVRWKKLLPTSKNSVQANECCNETAEQQLYEEVAAEKQLYADGCASVESRLDAALRDKLHIAMDASSLGQYRSQLRASLGDAAYVVAVLGLSGRGKTSLIQNYLNYIGRVCKCLRNQAELHDYLVHLGVTLYHAFKTLKMRTNVFRAFNCVPTNS
jgi:hypothetical protein